MKVLILTGIFPPDIGGPATQLGYLIPDLMKRGFKISVLTFGNSERSSDLPREVGAPAYPVKKISKKIPQPWRNILYILKALKMSFGFQAVYVWDLYTAGFSGFLIKKLFPKKKFIVRFAGDSAWEKARGEEKISENLTQFIEKKYSFSIEFRKGLRKKIMTSADAVVAVSYFLEGVAEKIGVKKERLKMIYNSVDFLFENKEEALRKPGAFAKPDFKGINLISASRLVPWKGQKILIEIMPYLIERHKNIRLWIIGDGPEFSNLKSQISNLKVEKNVFLLGRISHQELFEYMRAGDIFLLNTDYEGLSHQILEAFYLGIPVITTSVCSNSELIENEKSGFLVGYNNKEEFKRTISSLIENPELKALFVKNAKTKLANFKWERLVEETAALLRSL